MDNKQIIVIQDLELYDIKYVLVGSKDLDKKEIFDYIEECERSYLGERDKIVELLMEKFNLEEIAFSELYA